VVLGDPGYYSRFGFAADPNLSLAGVPAEYFQQLSFEEQSWRGLCIIIPHLWVAIVYFAATPDTRGASAFDPKLRKSDG